MSGKSPAWAVAATAAVLLASTISASDATAEKLPWGDSAKPVMVTPSSEETGTYGGEAYEPAGGALTAGDDSVYEEGPADDSYALPDSPDSEEGTSEGAYEPAKPRKILPRSTPPSSASAYEEEPIPAPTKRRRTATAPKTGGTAYEEPGYEEPGYGEPVYVEPGPGPGPSEAYGEPGPPPSDGGFTIDEINRAGHRFFGKITSGLAEVIEYSFQNAGRPNGYILGEEGGGAFIAGLRYGEGTLHTKYAGNHKVFWQGPSIGYDFGAEGSKTMILVYNLRSPSDIFRTFGGVSGSAYLVGGVGLTFLKNDEVVTAPIRSGIGLRLGANVGYLKYTSVPTWNPF